MKIINFIGIYIILFISVIFSFSTDAATIKGVLKNEKREVIPNQKVFLNNEYFSVTDKSGNIFFKNIEKGNYNLSTNIGDEKIILKQFVVTNSSEEINLGDVYFVNKIYQLKEVQISEIYTSRTNVSSMRNAGKNISLYSMP